MNGWLTAERSLRGALGIGYVWFGALKVIGMSPALPLVRGAYEPLGSVPLYLGLAVFEVGLGVVLLLGVVPRWAAAAAVFHLLGTFAVLASSPEIAFLPGFPFLTLEGEFVVKNLVLLAAAGVVWRSADAVPVGSRARATLAAGLVIASVAAGIGSARLHHATRDAARRPLATEGVPIPVPAEALARLAGGETTSFVVEGQVANRCPLLGCWMVVRDASGDLFIDLAPGGLNARGLAVGSPVVVTGRLGKTREGAVGFIADSVEPAPVRASTTSEGEHL